MDQKTIAKQMLQFNKTAFDNSFNALNMVYEQNNKMITTFLDQAVWMPAEGKRPSGTGWRAMKRVAPTSRNLWMMDIIK